ncbi:MAG: TRAP transporter substrate-binding protein DctP [Acidobacteria bacterium]|nr:TRAP transporter substrate-binding protein DctP [Acidobacteriota bacterium]
MAGRMQRGFHHGLLLAVAVVLLLSPALLVAQRANLRLGTILPANSIWDRALKQMASEWQQKTDGRVRLQVRGTTGDEATIIRRMRLNNPQVAALTLPGLTEIDDSFAVLGIPFFLASDAEALHVLEALTPLYREKLAEQGLVLLGWGHGGWAHIFSAQPIRSVPDLQKAKLFTAAGDDGMVQWYRRNGFQPVPLELTDVLMGLNTGLIDAYPSPPYGALVFQWYRQTSHMLDIPLSPVFGATVMTERAWNRIDEADRDALLEAAAGMQAFLFDEVPRQDEEAVAEMEKRGLMVSTVAEAEVTMLRTLVDALTATWRGDRVPADIYDAAIAARGEFRAN